MTWSVNSHLEVLLFSLWPVGGSVGMCFLTQKLGNPICHSTDS